MNNSDDIAHASLDYVDVLVKQAFGETEARDPLVTANDFLTLAKKFIDPGG